MRADGATTFCTASRCCSRSKHRGRRRKDPSLDRRDLRPRHVGADTPSIESNRAQATSPNTTRTCLASRLIERNGDRLRVFMKLRRTNLITVTYNTEHAVEYKRISATRATARSVATKIAELANAGTPEERERSADDDNGFLWRLNAYWRYEAVPGGVIIECESVSLSRAVPLLVRPVANPIVDRVARESLNRTLTGLRTLLDGEEWPAGLEA